MNWIIELLNGLRYLLHELSLSIFNTLNFLKHQSTLDSSEISAASIEPASVLYHSRGRFNRQNTMTVLVHLLNLHDQRQHSSHSWILNSLVVDTLSYSGWGVVVVVVDRNVCNILLISSGYWSITAWPAFSICTSHAPGIFPAMIKEFSCGWYWLSSVPVMTNVGLAAPTDPNLEKIRGDPRFNKLVA